MLKVSPETVFATGSPQQYIDFIGDKGGIRLQYGKDFTIYTAEHGALVEYKPEFEMRNHFQNEIDAFIECCKTGEKSTMELSGSNVLRFELADGTVILVRPSGTEPKIKVYVLTKGADAAERDANIAKYAQWVKTLS